MDEVSEGLVTPRIQQEIDLLCNTPQFRMLQRHIVAADAESNHPEILAIPLANEIGVAISRRLTAAVTMRGV